MSVFQSLDGLAWSACEEVDLALLDQKDAFEQILKRLDVPFQYDEDDEKPARIEELVNLFYRTKNETLREYLLRFENLIARLGEVRLTLPEELLGHFLLYRAAVPRHQIPNVRSHTGK